MRGLIRLLPACIKHYEIDEHKIGRPAARTSMKASLVTRELLSALADDQLDRQSCSGLLDACKLDESSLDCWMTYHLIGDQLRSPAKSFVLANTDHELAFVRRLSKRLADETSITFAPVLVKTALSAPLLDQCQHDGQAANDSNFRWKLVAVVASVTAIAAIAWNALELVVPSSSPQLAEAPATQIVVTSSQGPVVRDLKLEELLAAHRQFGTASALQDSSGFLRNATFDMPLEMPAGSGR